MKFKGILYPLMNIACSHYDQEVLTPLRTSRLIATLILFFLKVYSTYSSFIVTKWLITWDSFLCAEITNIIFFLRGKSFSTPSAFIPFLQHFFPRPLNSIVTVCTNLYTVREYTGSYIFVLFPLNPHMKFVCLFRICIQNRHFHWDIYPARCPSCLVIYQFTVYSKSHWFCPISITLC